MENEDKNKKDQGKAESSPKNKAEAIKRFYEEVAKRKLKEEQAKVLQK